jgi:hypothetical protein
MTQETAAQTTKNQLKPSIKKEKTEELNSKPMHGQFYWELERPSADKEKSLVWFCSSGLKYNNSSPISNTQTRNIIRGSSQQNKLLINAACAIRVNNT